MYKLAKKPQKFSIEQQIDNLKRRVYLQHPDFQYQEGIIVSLEVNKKYWVWLDKPYKMKNGNFSRKKEFNKEHIRLL